MYKQKKQKQLPSGFLSTKGEPTHNSILMYFIYLNTLPQGWSIDKICDDSVQKVREYFGVNYGFKAMIKWGISHECHKSQTSSGRHVSMSKAYILAKSLIGSGVQLSPVGSDI